MYEYQLEQIRKIREINDIILAPQRKMIEQVKSYQGAIDQAKTIINHPSLTIIKQIQATTESITAGSRKSTNISDCINAYNKTREFINDINNYTEIEDEYESLRNYNQLETMPDIEETLLSSTDIQKEEFKEVMYEIVEEMTRRNSQDNTKNETGDKSLSRISASIGIFVSVPQIPEALERYRAVLIVIYNLFFEN